MRCAATINDWFNSICSTNDALEGKHDDALCVALSNSASVATMPLGKYHISAIPVEVDNNPRTTLLLLRGLKLKIQFSFVYLNICFLNAEIMNCDI